MSGTARPGSAPGSQRLEVAPGRWLQVHDEGPRSAPTLVLLHALGTDSSLWAPQRAALRERRRIICIDAPGHGGSPPWSELTLQALGESVWQVTDQLGASRVCLAGTSMGAVTALHAAGLRPQQVQRLVLCGARLVRSATQGADLRERAGQALQDLAAIAEEMVGRWFPAASSATPAMRDAVRQTLLHTSPQGYASCAAALDSYDLSPQLQLVQDRAWLVAGTLDGDVPEHFRMLARSFAAHLVLLDGVGHFPALERPEALAPLLTWE